MRDIDRLYRYKSLLTSRHAVASEELMATLGISIATLKRDMARLRETLSLPVVYDRLAGGYRLAPGNTRRELPGMWLTPQELVALVTLQHLLSELAPGLLGHKLAPLRERLAHLLHDIDIDSLGLAQRMRVVHAGQRRLPQGALGGVWPGQERWRARHLFQCHRANHLAAHRLQESQVRQAAHRRADQQERGAGRGQIQAPRTQLRRCHRGLPSPGHWRVQAWSAGLASRSLIRTCAFHQ